MTGGDFHMVFEGPFQPTVLHMADRVGIPILKNAYHRWSDHQDGWLPVRHYPDHAPLIIDSGGFNVLTEGYTEFPWSVEDYDRFLREYPTDIKWAAPMDYACETRFDDQISKQERMDKTLENTIEHFDLDPEYTLRPVLQGRSVEDYVWFYDQLQDYGIPTDRVALGTVCRLNSSKEIVRVEQSIREKTDIDQLHGFGVKVAAFKLGATFDSADSRAWGDAPDHGKIAYDDGDRLKRVPHDDETSKRAVLTTFAEYHRYASRLMNDAHEKREREGTQDTLEAYA